MSLIKESFFLTATNTDILAAPSRLAAIPADGILTIEVSSTDSDPTNFGTLTLQTPDGDVPFENLHIPFNAFGNGSAILHNDTELMIQLDVTAGGHVGLSYTETGVVLVVIIIVTLTF